MRIVAGEMKGHSLRTPKGAATRPTSGLVRETLFNIIAPRLGKAHLLDLYAGSGSVGLEGISRGVIQAVFVENARPALACLRDNITALHAEETSEIIPLPVARALAQLMQHQAHFEIIFLDPPFADKTSYQEILSLLAGSKLLAEQGIVIAQHDKRFALEKQYDALHCYRQKEIGDNMLSFYQLIDAQDVQSAQNRK